MLIIKNLYKAYSNNKVLNGVCLELKKGALQTLIGPNGSGKSTLVNIIAGLVPYKKGSLQFNNQKLENSNQIRPADFGFVLENPLLIDRFSVKEFLAFTCFLQKMNNETCEQRTFDLSHLLNIPIEKKIEDLSKGQKMKVAISAALIHNPKCLIMDEPFNGIDFQSTRIIGQLLRRKVQAGASILITSHQYDLILELSDKIAVLNEGKINHNFVKKDLINELGIDPMTNSIKDKMVNLMGYDQELKLPDWV